VVPFALLAKATTTFTGLEILTLDVVPGVALRVVVVDVTFV